MRVCMPSPSDSVRIRLSFVGDPLIEIPALAKIEGEIPSSDLKIQYKAMAVLNRPESKVDIIVTMVYYIEQTMVFTGSLKTSFDVVDLASFITAKEGEDGFQIETDFLPMLLSTAFSTTRGYMVRELSGSALATYPFPMVSLEGIQKRTTYRLI